MANNPPEDFPSATNQKQTTTIKEAAASYLTNQENKDVTPITQTSRKKIVKIIVEQHPDTFIAYPLSIDGAVVGQGDTAEEALSQCISALQAHIEVFGPEVLEVELPVVEAFVTEAEINY
jgi:predicted RNase H-like HicB family nuclease